MRYHTRQRMHLDLRELPTLPAAATRPLPTALARPRIHRDPAEHTRELRHERRTLRQQLHDLVRIDPRARAEWQLDS